MSEAGYAELAGAVQQWIRTTLDAAGARGVVLGISGGLDSAVSAALCAGALGPGNVLGLLMPCGSLPEDTRDGERIAGFLGIRRKTVCLDGTLECLTKAADLDSPDRLGLGNIKARLRMTVIYAHSRGRLVAGTSNRSEYLMGYWTKWADGAADFQPLLELYKSQVFHLAGALGLPEWLLERVPSAGLWPGQSDEGEMGVTYRQIEDYFERGAGSVPPKAAERIRRLHGASGHKRNPVPYFQAERWFRDHV